jgi:hypothetical protein
MRKWALPACLLAGLLAGIGAFFLRPQPKPEYAWLVFGPEGSIRVLVTLNGEAVTLDHYYDDKPTGRKDRFPHRLECKDVTIDDPRNKTTYTMTGMSGTAVKEGEPTELFADVTIQGPVGYRQYCDLTMTATTDAARLAHFHGPLTVEVKKTYWKMDSGLALRRGDKPTEMQVCVGTMNAEKGCWVAVRTHENDQPAFPKGVYPFVDVEFPPQNVDDPPIKRRYPLSEFC